MSTRAWSGLLASLLMLLFTSPVIADKPSEGCSFLGSWIGFNPDGDAYFTSIAEGSNNAVGTYTLEVIVEPSLFAFLFPGAAEYTEFRGTWRRVDGYTFEVSVVSIALDANRQTIGIGKIRAIDTLNLSCEKMTIQGWLDVFDPDVNPFTDDYNFSVPLEPHEAHRMTIP